MAEIFQDISVRLRVLNPQRQPLDGTVDIELKPLGAGDTVSVKGADASKDIDVSGLQRPPLGIYQVTVTPTDVPVPVLVGSSTSRAKPSRSPCTVASISRPGTQRSITTRIRMV